MGNAVMPAKRLSRSKEPKQRLAIAVTLKGSPEWKQWLEEFADFCRLDVAKVIDAALVEHAKVKRFTKEPPRR